MKSLIITGALLTITGFTIGWTKATERYEAKTHKEQAAYANALDELAKQMETGQWQV